MALLFFFYMFALIYQFMSLSTDIDEYFGETGDLPRGAAKFWPFSW